MPGIDELRNTLDRIDGRGYKAYKDIRGSYDFGNLSLHIDHVQGDPFAAPSKMRVRIPAKAAQLPNDLYKNRVRRIALQDALARQVARSIRHVAEGSGRGSGKSGLIEIDAGRQEVLERTALLVTEHWVEARVHAGLPARGRRVLGRQAAEMLCEELPQIATQSLTWYNLPQKQLRAFVECVENQEHIRGQLDQLGLVAFVGDGAILPRQSGASDHPLAKNEAVPFRSPPEMEVRIDVPNPLIEGETSVTGMGVPKGVTLIVGGGYHGKSTLLKAIERGVYAHIPGDGREYVVTARDAVKIRAEDGRRVASVDISPFISNLPGGRSTASFSTEDASGSTSQAANIVEAIEVGAGTLLLDEDTSATNFMVRDARMQALVSKENEPITPFLDRVRELSGAHGVSTVLVMGGCGDYFESADRVIMMKEFLPYEVTEEARAVARERRVERQAEVAGRMAAPRPRIPVEESFDPSRGRRQVKIDAKAVDTIVFGTDRIDLRGVEQLVDLSQTRAIGNGIHLAVERFMNGERTLREIADAVQAFFDEEGLDALDPFHRRDEHPGDFARPRKFELAAAINRLRSVRMRQK